MFTKLTRTIFLMAAFMSISTAASADHLNIVPLVCSQASSSPPKNEDSDSETKLVNPICRDCTPEPEDEVTRLPLR